MLKKNLKIIILFLFCFSFRALFSESLSYKFKKEKPLKYKFKIAGNIFFSYNPEEKNSLPVSASGILNIKTLKEKEPFIIEITPGKTIITVKDMLLEDITKSDTEISRIVSTVKMEIEKNGKINKIEEIKPNIINIGKLLSLIPAFPEEKIFKGKMWKQKISSFEIPGFLKMCNLTFNYFVSDVKGGKYTIKLLSNQIINEKEKDKDITVKFSGTNNSKGTFIFDAGKGEIEEFNGNFKLHLNVFFIVPPSPGEKTKKQTLPMKLKIDLSVSLIQQ